MVTTTPAPNRIGWRRILEALEIPGFRLLFVNGLFASVGNTASHLVQIWLVLSVSDDSAFWVGVSVLLAGLGRVVFSLIGGVIADQFDRRLLLLTVQLFTSGLTALVAVTTFLGAANLPVALFVSLTLGSALTVDMTITNALVFDLAGRERILNALSLRRISTVPVMIGGSLLMGWLLASVGTWAAYAFVSGCLFVAPWALLWLPPTAVQTPDHQPLGLLPAAIEGLRFAAHDRQIRTLLLVALGMETFGFAYLTMIPVVAKNVLDVGALGLGQITAASGVGCGLAILGVAALGNFHHKPLLLFCTAMGAGASLLAFSLSRSLPLSMLCALLTTGCLTAYDITIGSLLQIVSPAHMRGRMISLHSLAIAFTSLGGFAMGAVGSVIGVPTMLAIGSAAIVSNLMVHRRRLLRIREQPPAGGSGSVVA